MSVLRILLRIHFLALVVMTFAAASSAAPTSAAVRPNIVFILADDLGWSDLGCYGSTFYETPNLDRLAREGTRFTDAYAACGVCSPTRASILTGKYPVRTGITSHIGLPQPDKWKKKTPMLPARYDDHLALGEVTLAEALKEGGYQTAFIGKWHLGDATNHWPEHQGFDVNFGGCGRGAPASYFSPYRLPNLPDGPKGESLNERLADEAVKFMEQANGAPFFIYLSQYAVHNPLQAKPEVIAKYRAKAAKLENSGPDFRQDFGRKVRQVQNHPTYAALVESLDDSVGRVLSGLQKLGLEDNTIVIFTSDNGGLSTSEGTPTSNLPWRTGKGWPYEGGVREPLLIKWPGVTAPDSVSQGQTTSPDFYPTILDMLGLPLRPQQHRDGVSIVPLLKGAVLPDRPLFWHYPHYSNQGGAPNGAVRLGDFKLIEWYEDMSVELFNLRDDLGEQHDLAKQNPAKTAELTKLLHEWRKQVNARMPTLNPNYRPAEKSSADAERATDE